MSVIVLKIVSAKLKIKQEGDEAHDGRSALFVIFCMWPSVDKAWTPLLHFNRLQFSKQKVR